MTLAALMIVGAVLEGVGLACFLPLVGLLVGSIGGGWLQSMVERGFGAAGIVDPGNRLIVAAAVFAAIMLLRAVVLAWRDRMLARLQIGFVEHKRLRLLQALARASWSRVAGLRHARITNAIGNDIARIAIASHLLLQSSVSAVMLAGQWTVALLIAPRLAGSVLVFLLIGLLVASRPAFRRAVAFGTTQGIGNLGLLDTAAQLLGGLKPAFAQNMQDAFTTEFVDASRALAKAQLAYQARQSRVRLSIATLAAVAGAVALIAGQKLGMQSAALLATLAIFSRMTGPLSVLLHNGLQIAAQLPAHASLEKLLGDLDPSPSATPVVTHQEIAGAISFAAVTYRHADGGGVRGVSLDLRPGEIVGVVGPSGAGKTTLVDLLAGLLLPSEGTIRVGPTAIDAQAIASWRDRVAYVAQEPYLFHDTIRRNLAWGSAPLDDDALWRALSLAGADGLVAEMADGLETIVGERGARLSGGERQRISLARAFLRRPALLILDEATNAIDIATERAILHRIVSLDPRPAVLLIAHRAETLAICERVITLEAGRIVSDAPSPGR